MIGQKVGVYEFLSEIGQGGYGSVYKAHDHSVNRDVAIKVILPQYANDLQFKQRFATEAYLVAQLEHPHIIPLYNYWQDDQGAFLVMRYISGGSLRHVLDQQEGLDVVRCARILDQIADALTLTHEQGIVHRDIKPANI